MSPVQPVYHEHQLVQQLHLEDGRKKTKDGLPLLQSQNGDIILCHAATVEVIYSDRRHTW